MNTQERHRTRERKVSDSGTATERDSKKKVEECHSTPWDGQVSPTNGTNVVGQNSDYDKSTVTGNTFLQLKVSIQMMKKCE